MPKDKTLKTSRQIVLWIAANAGGVGKTTLGIHIGYRFAQLGLKVLFIDLDTNGSLARFCGLDPDPAPLQSSAALFDRNFTGNYPVFAPEWGDLCGNFDACLGGDIMLGVALDLPSRAGREMILKKALKKYPVPYDLIILDSPASLDVLSYSALAVATHILLPLPMSIKLAGIDSLLSWIRMESDALDLDPAPKLLGGVPMRVAANADQKAFKKEITSVLAHQSVNCFPSVRFSIEFENAANRGIAPLYIYRSKHPACNDFEPVITAISKEFDFSTSK